MNETHKWYYFFCDKTVSIESKSKQYNSRSHKQKEEFGTVVKEIKFFRPEYHEMNYILSDTVKDCRIKYFLSFEKRCLLDIRFSKMENIEEVKITITLGYMKFKYQFYRLNKKNRNHRKKDI